MQQFWSLFSFRISTYFYNYVLIYFFDSRLRTQFNEFFYNFRVMFFCLLHWCSDSFIFAQTISLLWRFCNLLLRFTFWDLRDRLMLYLLNFKFFYNIFYITKISLKLSKILLKSCVNSSHLILKFVSFDSLIKHFFNFSFFLFFDENKLRFWILVSRVSWF